jgi:hypothetical protein
MDKFREELIKGIIEVAQETGLSVNQCIYEAKKMLRQQMKEQYKKQLEAQMLKGW